MSEHPKEDAEKPTASDQQPDEATEANKPDEARAKGKPEAGNILGGVQPKS